MSDQGGVLGASQQTSVNTHTVYQVPTGKWARGRFFFRGQADASSAATLALLVNGVRVAQSVTFAASAYVWSDDDQLINSNATQPSGGSGLTVLPFAKDFYLSESDLVQMVIGGAAFQSMEMQFVGVELDVPE